MKKLCPHSTPTISQALDCAQHELCQPYIRRDKGFNILARINTANLMQNLVDDGLAVVFLHQEDDELGKWRGEVFEVREQVQDARCRSKVKMELPDGHAKKSKHRSPGVRILGHGWWSCGGVCDTEMMQVSNCVCVCVPVFLNNMKESISGSPSAMVNGSPNIPIEGYIGIKCRSPGSSRSLNPVFVKRFTNSGGGVLPVQSLATCGDTS